MPYVQEEIEFRLGLVPDAAVRAAYDAFLKRDPAWTPYLDAAFDGLTPAERRALAVILAAIEPGPAPKRGPIDVSPDDITAIALECGHIDSSDVLAIGVAMPLTLGLAHPSAPKVQGIFTALHRLSREAKRA